MSPDVAPAGPTREPDTIVACATPAGAGERAVVRLSGPDAERLLLATLGADAAAVTPRVGRAVDARLALGGGADLPVTLLLWRAPRSATGEHVGELHLPAWPPVVTEAVRRAVRAGARPAARGEFTRRAVAHGRIDAAGALAVGRLAEARDATEVFDAAAVLCGAAPGPASGLRGALLDALALIEAHVDFEEEDTEAVGRDQLRAALVRARDRSAGLLALTARAPGRDGECDVALVGAPNAGKSSLQLALCPGACTSVSPLPGTTRDALDARLEIGGRVVRVIDGPGVGGGLAGLDQEAGAAYLAQIPVDAVALHVVDPGDDRPPAPSLAAWLAAHPGPRLTVLTKADLHSGRPRDDDALAVSSLTGEGLDALRDRLLALRPEPPSLDALIGGEAEAAADVLPALDDALAHDWEGRLPLLSLVLRDALERLEREATRPLDLTEEVLARVFSRFCIGK